MAPPYRVNQQLAALPSLERVIAGTLSTAQVNAGTAISVDVPAQTVRVMGFTMVARGGNAGGCTGVYLQDNAGTIVGECMVANLTQNTPTHHFSSSNTGANLRVPLTAGKGLKIIKDGSNLTTATSLDWVVEFVTV